MHESRTTEGLYPAREVANYFIQLSGDDIGDDEGRPAGITHLKLQKLLFIAQGYYLGILGKPLFDEDIEAWKHGPVVPSVWNEYKDREGNPIKYKNADSTQTYLLEEDQDIIKNEIWDVFGRYAGSALVDIVRRQDPWKNAHSIGERTIISKSAIKSYYSELQFA